MGTVYKETYTKPLPEDAELSDRKRERFARWTDRRGRKRVAKVTTTNAGEDRLLLEAGTYTARYRDGSGVLRKVSARCRSLDAAKAVLMELQTRADKVRSGSWTAAEEATLDHKTASLGYHIDVYVEYLRHKRGKGNRPQVSPKHIVNVEHNLRRVCDECHFQLLRDINLLSLERWAKHQLDGTQLLSARSLNAHLSAVRAFGNWCVISKRLVTNPVSRIPRMDEKSDPRRPRRALTDDECHRLLHVAQLRPLAEYGRATIWNPAAKDQRRRTWTKASLTFETIDDCAQLGCKALAKHPGFIAGLKRTGRERALIYKTLILTGLRRGELASLTVGQLELDGSTAYATLAAVDDKAGRGADVPLRTDLVMDLKAWLADKLEEARSEAKASGEPVPVNLPVGYPLFNVPLALVRILDRDLAAAGIAKRDDRGRTVDVHAMRHTFGTHLSKGGVSPRTAQAAMRHSTIDLTMSTYTDPRLLDVAGALDVLPSLPLDDDPHVQRIKATGTGARTLVPMLVQTPGNHGTNRTIADKMNRRADPRRRDVSVDTDKSSQSKSTGGEKRVKGLEPSTFSLGS